MNRELGLEIWSFSGESAHVRVRLTGAGAQGFLLGGGYRLNVGMDEEGSISKKNNKKKKLQIKIK